MSRRGSWDEKTADSRNSNTSSLTCVSVSIQSDLVRLRRPGVKSPQLLRRHVSPSRANLALGKVSDTRGAGLPIPPDLHPYGRGMRGRVQPFAHATGLEVGGLEPFGHPHIQGRPTQRTFVGERYAHPRKRRRRAQVTSCLLRVGGDLRGGPIERARLFATCFGGSIRPRCLEAFGVLSGRIEARRLEARLVGTSIGHGPALAGKVERPSTTRARARRHRQGQKQQDQERAHHAQNTGTARAVAKRPPKVRARRRDAAAARDHSTGERQLARVPRGGLLRRADRMTAHPHDDVVARERPRHSDLRRQRPGVGHHRPLRGGFQPERHGQRGRQRLQRVTAAGLADLLRVRLPHAARALRQDRLGPPLHAVAQVAERHGRARGQRRE